MIKMDRARRQVLKEFAAAERRTTVIRRSNGIGIKSADPTQDCGLTFKINHGTFDLWMEAGYIELASGIGVNARYKMTDAGLRESRKRS